MDKDSGAGNLIVNGFLYTPTGVGAGFSRHSRACFVKVSVWSERTRKEHKRYPKCGRRTADGSLPTERRTRRRLFTVDQEVLSSELNESLERSR